MHTQVSNAHDLSARQEIARNVRIHDRLAKKYESLHGEIFNEVEQNRLSDALTFARDAVRSRSTPMEALDFGCGSGNLTRHLLRLGLNVTAADVSNGFLDLVANRYPQVRTFLMSAGDLSSLPSGAYDVIATYSVLHHVPDYLAACTELARLCRPGGVIVIDHEASEEFWQSDPTYLRFRAEALRFDWRKFLRPSNYAHRIRRIFNPRYSNEGDIHVWPDDHVEWPKISALLTSLGFEVVLEQSYLLNRKLYRPEVYSRYVGRCSDTKIMMFRKEV